jgi:hypothetical protein
MPTEEPEFQQVLICLGQTSEQFQQMAWSCQRKPGMGTAKFSFKLRSFPDQQFEAAFDVNMDDPDGNFLEWYTLCTFRNSWRVTSEILLSRKDKKYDTEGIFDFPEMQITSASDLIRALDTAVADIKTSIESRDISSWVELCKT